MDTTFDVDGWVVTDFNNDTDNAYAVALQSDGKIILAGNAHKGLYYDFALARYNTDGSLDTTFNGDGRVTTDFFGICEWGHAVAIQSDGKIIIAGSAYNGDKMDFALARYTPNGSLDASFDGDGKVVTDFFGGYDYGSSLAIQSNGKIVLSGTAFYGEQYDLALARYNTDGSLDTSFNGNGRVVTDYNGGNDWGYSNVVRSNGNIVVAGIANNGTDYDFVVMRYK